MIGNMARHHYVPQFYLKNFSQNRKDILVYKRGEKAFSSGIANLAAANDFYAIKDEKTGKKDETIEKFFSQLESAAKPIIEIIINSRKINICEDERKSLTHFFGFLYVRNQTFRQKTKNWYAEMMKQTMAFAAHDKERFHQMLKNSGATDRTEKELEDTRQFALEGNYDIGFKEDDHFIGATLSLAKDIMPIFWGKNWKLLSTTTSRIFVTSDNPMPISQPRNHIKNHFGGLGLLEADIFLPLSPNLVMLFTNDATWPELFYLKRGQVDSMNKLIASFAQNFLFSNIESKDISNIFNQTKEGESSKVYIDNSFLRPKPTKD